MARFTILREKHGYGDPLRWNVLIALLFMGLVTYQLGIPSRIYFDEVHYVPAARSLLALKSVNTEHPLFAKTLIAAAIHFLGDTPNSWRVPSVLFGALGMLAFGRLLWFASLSRFASLSGQFLLVTGFAWYVQSRIAMLDMIMAGLIMTALWMLASAIRARENFHWRLAISGLCMGLSLGSKWSVLPIVVLPGIVFVALKLRDDATPFLTSTEGGPIPGVSLLAGAFWLVVFPMVVYWATFTPAFNYVDKPIDPQSFIAQHFSMMQLQDSVVKPHPYRSVWYQWVANWRAIWYLYEEADGAQRGILMLGNPFTMLAGLPAVVWCLWAGLRRGQMGALALGALYLLTLGLWVVSGKPIQFYYHYLLPGTFLLGCLALTLDAMFQRGDGARAASFAALLVSGAMFVHFWPIISGSPLSDKLAFNYWMWLPGWR